MFATPTKRIKISATLAAAGLGLIMLGAGNLESESILDQAPKAQVGQQAPDFTLTDLQGNEHTLSEYTADGQTVVLEWFSPMCPFVKKHYRGDTMTMVNIQNEHKDDSVVWLRINSAKASHPAAKLSTNQKTAEKWGITTPILMDSKGSVGKNYGAKRTPEMYIIDSTGMLVYHGAIDNRPDAAAPGDVNYVKNALNQTLAGESVTTPTTKAYGCSVKY
ncbi:MAG: thioredoxin family protein [Phycisphaerales bacterium]|nr:thioredoxin family protein [Phycisphaerales bacterium]